MTTVLLALESALLVLLTLFVMALLRSHADILRRLAGAEQRLGGAPMPAPPVVGDERARDIAGRTLAGDTAKVALGPGSPTTLLAFLSSGCAACGPLWEGASAGVAARAARRVVIVAKDPEEESIASLRELAPADGEVLMSSAAWAAYAVPGSPHFVLVDGASGRIAGQGAAGSWEQIGSILAQALADAAEDALVQGPGGSGRMGTAARAGRAEEALAAAGIGPGHTSLYAAGAAGDEAERR